MSKMQVVCTAIVWSSVSLLAVADPINGLRSSVARVGDVDGDGYEDFALAPRGDFGVVADPAVQCSVFVLSGRTGNLLRILEPTRSSSGFGRAIVDLGDLDGRGVRDLAVTSDDCIWVFSGEQGQLLFRIDQSGYVAGGADIDDDGYLDFGICALGTLSIYSGATGHLLNSFGCDGNQPSSLGGKAYGPFAFLTLGKYTRRPGIALIMSGRCDNGGKGDYSLALFGVQNPEMVTSVPLEPVYQGTPWIVREIPDIDADEAAEVLVSVANSFVALFSSDSGAAIRVHRYGGGYRRGEGTSAELLQDIDGDGSPEYVIAANEDGFDCDAGFIHVFSGREGLMAHEINFDGIKAGPGECEAGADACVIKGPESQQIVIHIPRLAQVRVIDVATFGERVRTSIASLVE